MSCENFLFHMSVDVSHQKDCHDVINTIHYVSEPLNKFTERLLKGLVIAPEVYKKNNACSALYREYLTFLQHPRV